MKRFMLTMLAVAACFATHAAAAQDVEIDPEPAVAEHSVFGAAQTTRLSVKSQVPDIKKLETRAVDILRDKSQLTLAEARAAVRIDGKTDVARCLEIIITHVVLGISQITAADVLVEHQHPVEASAGVAP